MEPVVHSIDREALVRHGRVVPADARSEVVEIADLGFPLPGFDLRITDGDDRPVKIEIKMVNSAGIYQVDTLLKAKLRGSGLEPYVEVLAHIDTEAEKRLVPIYRLET